MSDNHCWLLPEGIFEALPEDACQLESLRRQLIDLYRGWGYQLVMPPLVEFMESLSTGTGKELDLQTFKLTDQQSGRLMGVRADITPQVARIDAHRMRVDHPNRLCYFGPVLRTRSNHANGGSRSPLQIGAELFGHSGIDSDFEVISLAIETLQNCLLANTETNAEKITLDFGHVGIFTEVSKALELDEADQEILSDMLERKSIPDIAAWTTEKGFTAAHTSILKALPELNGSVEVIAQAKDLFAGFGDQIQQILKQIDELVQRLQQAFPDIAINLDFGELRGYAYHTGIMFQLYLPSVQRELIRGGRYDGIGEAFGNSRPATGFSADLRLLNRLSGDKIAARSKILAPNIPDPELDQMIRELREQGNIVIRQLHAGTDEQEYTAEALGCNQQIVNSDNHWVITNS
jgi:ATP phosphoribosyltransferase regulatory subunit